MRKEDGLSSIALIIIILIIIGIFGVAVKLTLGNDGLVAKTSEEEIDFCKTEVFGDLKSLTAEKYLAIYNEKSGDDMQNNFNTEIFLKNFLSDESHIIEYEKSIDSEGYRYYIINLSGLKRNINTFGSGDWESGDVFAIRRALTVLDGNVVANQECEVCYKPKGADSSQIDVIGTLNIEHPVK